MSSLLELIARRRRATAGRRLGPPEGHTWTNGNGRPANGSAENPAENGHGAPVAQLLVAEPALDRAPAAPIPLAPTPLIEIPALIWPPAAPESEESRDDEERRDEEERRDDEAEAPAIKPLAALPRYESWLPPAELLAPPPAPVVAPEPPVVVPEPAVVAPEPPVVVPEPAVVAPEPPVVAPGPPAAADPFEDAPGVTTAPRLRERGRIRRRARYLRQLRELQLRDIGGFELELHRFGRERPDLVRTKIQNAARTDEELRELERALDGRVPLRELREPGIGGACAECGAVHGSRDRFCAACGSELPGR